jgi:large subunit ribosomal protein L15
MLYQLSKVNKNKRIRRGRGNGRKGTTAGRGTKGQKARTGHKKMRPGFEGGRTPLARILPKKKGIGQGPRSYAHPINLSELGVFTKGQKVSLGTLKDKGLVPKSAKHVKILSEGELKEPLIFILPEFALSASAKAKIAKAGGSFKEDKTAQDKATPDSKK